MDMIDYRPNNFGTLFVPEDSLDDNVCVVYVFVKIYDGTSSALDGVAGKCLGLVRVFVRLVSKRYKWMLFIIPQLKKTVSSICDGTNMRAAL